jgi:hypothetical protein
MSGGRTSPGAVAGLAVLVALGAGSYLYSSSRQKAREERVHARVERRIAEEQRRLEAARERARRATAAKSRRSAPTAPPGILEKGPHPDYPTPIGAGTDKLFFLEEPERGPRATQVDLPSGGGLRWTVRPHCEVGHLGLACGEKLGRAPTGEHWRVGGASDGRPVLATRLFGTRERERYGFFYDGKALDRIVKQGSRGIVEWTRFYDPKDRGRYSARELGGSNALPGCGYIRVARAGVGGSVEATCLQWLGEPMRDKSGVTRTSAHLDAHGFVVEEVYSGVDGSPVVSHAGTSRRSLERSSEGRVVHEAFLDAEGRPAASTEDGCFGHRSTYAPSGLRAAEVCLGADGEPLKRKRASVVERAYDDAGCLVLEKHVGADSSPATTYYNIHATRFAVGERCEVRSKTCLNIVEQPVRCGPNEPARYVYARDERGRVTTTKHYAPDGKPGQDPSYQVFEIRTQHDDLGRQVGFSCYDQTGQAAGCDRTGFHAIRFKVDEVGRTVEERFYDRVGAPTTNLGCTIRRYQYDSYDHLYETRNYDDKGELVDTLGMSIKRSLFDAGHRVFGLLLLDRQGNPAKYTGCFAGRTCPNRPWHAVRIVRAADGTVDKNLYFDAQGQLVHTILCGSSRCWY